MRVRDSSAYRWVLEEADLPTGEAGDLDFDPMSNTSFRVLLLRPQQEPLLMRGLTVAFVVLLVAAALAAVWELRRPVAPPSPAMNTTLKT